MTLILLQSEVPTAKADWATTWSELLQFWPILALSFGASLILTPIMRKLALANGIVDLPDARRKAHAKPVAYLGGLSIYLGWLVGLCAFVAILFNGDEQSPFATLLGENMVSAS